MRDGRGARVPLQASVLPGSTTSTRSCRRARTGRRRSPAPLPMRGRDLQPEISFFPRARAVYPHPGARGGHSGGRSDDLTDNDEPDHRVLAAPASKFGETDDVKVPQSRLAVSGNSWTCLGFRGAFLVPPPGIGLAMSTITPTSTSPKGRICAVCIYRPSSVVQGV